jgi:phosphoglycerate dehydrogenase-like enzyme
LEKAAGFQNQNLISKAIMSAAAAGPAITVFTSITKIAPALRQAAPSIPLIEIVDEALGGHGGTVEFQATNIQESTRRELAQAEILITEPVVLAALLEVMELPNLKWCQSTYAGVDPLFPLTTSTIPNFTLTRFAGKFGPPMAEWCLARIIGHERNFDLSRQDQERQEWAGCSKEVLQYRYLSDLTLSILGCGDIGLCIARAAKAFGMRVVGYATTVKTDPALDDSTTSLAKALEQADYIVSVLPSTADTHGILTESMFQNTTKAPVFVNVGRGSVTTTSDIIGAIDNGYLSAAILDVVHEEPLPKESLLWKHPRVTISPHVSGLTRGQDVPNLVLDNYQRYIDKRSLLYVVDWQKTY